MFENLSNKTILITGASRGIGNALAKILYSKGVQIIAVARTKADLNDLQNECPTIQTICVDLSDWGNTRASLSNVPHLDGLVNNAGIAIIKPFEEITENDFDNTFNVNIKAVFNVIQALSSKLKTGSSIVNISSLAAQRSFTGHSVYSATKAALDSLTKSLALEFGARKIRVNAVNPTVILTKMGLENWSNPAKSEPLLSHIPLNSGTLATYGFLSTDHRLEERIQDLHLPHSMKTYLLYKDRR